ncbi:MAG: carbohydrate ABC transporter permease [bacterium]|nr:carbohydrate ABC transporter permease [bacterium]
MRSGTWSRPAVFLFVVLAAFVFALPLVWMVATSLKPQDELTTTGLALLPEDPSNLAQYAYENYYGPRPLPDPAGAPQTQGRPGVLTNKNVNFLLFLRNTLIVAVLSVSGMVISSAVVAYGFSRVHWRGRGVFFAIMLATLMVPFPATMIPTYFIFKHLGWVGTLRPLWVPAWFGGAFNIFLLRQFFLQIPQELSDAARLDGLSHWGVFWRIILPLARPALLVVALLHAVYVWNDFLGPLVFLHHQDQFTLALGLQFYQHQHGGTPWNVLMAACTLTVAPVLLVYLICQRAFTGLSVSTGLKG